MPVFLAQGAYLRTETLLKLLGGAGEIISDRNPVFTATDAIDIFLPSKPPIPPGYALIICDNINHLDPAFRDTYRVNQQSKVVDGVGNRYKGEV